MKETEIKHIKPAVSAFGSSRHGLYYSYLKCLEYACVVDISLKLISIFMPATGYVKDNRVYMDENCHKLFTFTRIVMYALKAWSVCISVIGIQAAINYNYSKLQLFITHMKLYCLAELFNLLFVVIVISTNKCSNLRSGQRIVHVLLVSIGGTVFITIYYLAWMFIADKCMAYLQNGKEEIMSDEMPLSFDGYGTIDKDDKVEQKDVQEVGSPSIQYEWSPQEDRRPLNAETVGSVKPLHISKLQKRQSPALDR